MGKRHGRSSAIKAAAPVLPHAMGAAIQAAPSPVIAKPILARPQGGPALVAYRILTALASLRLTVVLFALSVVLVFFGTLAMMDQGLFAVLHGYFRAGIAWVPWMVFVRFGQTFFGVPHSVQVSGSFPFPGGWLLGSLLLVNVLAAHAVRFRVSWKRAGVLILHAGLIILMLGELVTGLFAVEARMTLAQDETVGFVEVANEYELAVIDPSGDKTDRVTAIPASLLKPGQTIHDDALPFDVQVIDYMVNTDLLDLRPGDADTEDVFTTITGRRCKVVACEEGKGVDSKSREDYPGVRVRLLKKGTNEVLGTNLLAMWFNPNSVNRQREYLFPEQKTTVDGKEYIVAFRPKRIYKPYAIHLTEFRHSVYPGTTKPKDFSSFVHLTDPSSQTKRETRISMNDPLRYSGETFYQSGFLPGDQGTVLQVVRNPGWLMPYFSCALVAIGMVVHFVSHLVEFLRRRFAL